MKKDIEKDIRRLGIDWINPNLFDLLDQKLVPIHGNNISYEEVLDNLKKQNLRPATILELLKWNGWDGHTPVIAAGSVVKHEDEWYVPCLCEVGFSEPGRSYRQRRLAMMNIHTRWRGDNIFLGVLSNADNPKNVSLPPIADEEG